VFLRKALAVVVIVAVSLIVHTIWLSLIFDENPIASMSRLTIGSYWVFVMILVSLPVFLLYVIAGVISPKWRVGVDTVLTICVGLAGSVAGWFLLSAPEVHGMYMLVFASALAVNTTSSALYIALPDRSFWQFRYRNSDNSLCAVCSLDFPTSGGRRESISLGSPRTLRG
jgi:hypothetical protein